MLQIRARGFTAICCASLVALVVAGCGKGDSGTIGATGPTGANGSNGANGASGATGATGANGATGATGPAVTTGTVSGTVTIKGASTTTAAAGAVVSAQAATTAGPAPVASTADSAGHYSLVLPVGTYTITFGADPTDGFDSATATATVAPNADLTLNASVARTNAMKITFASGGAAVTAPGTVNTTPTLYAQGFGSSGSIKASASGVPAGATLSYTWTQVTPGIPTGVPQPPLAAYTAASDTVSFTMPEFQSIVVDADDPTYSWLPPEEQVYDLPNLKVPLRHQAIGVPVWVETRLTYQFKVTVKATTAAGDSISTSATVAVRPTMYSAAAQAGELPGSATTDTVPRYVVPVGQPVIFAAPRFPFTTAAGAASAGGLREAGTYNWTLTNAAGDTAAALDRPNGQFVSFTPQVEGLYVLSSTMKDSTGASYPVPNVVPPGSSNLTPPFSAFAPWTVKILAAKYIGFEGTSPNPNVSDNTCTGCHDTLVVSHKSTAAADWRTSGHSKLFKLGIDSFEGSHYGGACIRCHTTGYAEGKASGVTNYGFVDVAKTTEWTFPTDLVDTGGVTGSHSKICGAGVTPVNGNCLPPTLAPLSAISCENCHGPGSLHYNRLGNTEGNTALGAYIGSSYSDQSCQACHAGSARHDRGAQLSKSGHKAYDLPLDDASLEARGKTALHCGRCHSAGGFDEYLQQIARNGLQPGSSTTPDTVLNGVTYHVGNMTVTTAVNPSAPTNAEYIKFITGKQLTSQLIEPVGCTTCHEPHTAKLRTETVTPDNGVTFPWVDNTPVLPAGFAFPSAGKGSLCMACHNTRNGLHDDGHVVASFTAPHTPSQTDMLAGRNAYFVSSSTGWSVGEISKHAAIGDTCVTCHNTIPSQNLDVLPPGYATTNADGAIKTNHTFKANSAICASCHAASVTGEAIQADVKIGHQNLSNAVGVKLLSVIKSYLNASASNVLLVAAWDRVTDGTAGTVGAAPYSGGDYRVKVGQQGAQNVDVTFDNFTGVATFDDEIHGQESACLMMTNAVPMTFVKADGTTVSYTNPGKTELCFQLGNLLVGGTITLAITGDGGNTAATFSLSGAVTVASATAAATYTVPGYGLQIKFPSGTYHAGDSFTLNLATMAVTPISNVGGSPSPAVAASSAGAPITYLLDPATSLIPRALWDWYLVRGDGSWGIHNPSHIYKVLNGAITAMQQ